jgi:hypothetical protein
MKSRKTKPERLPVYSSVFWQFHRIMYIGLIPGANMKKLLKSPFLWGIVVGVVLCIPSINSYDFIATDCTQVGHLEGVLDYPGLGPLTLYNFADGSPEHMTKLISKGFYPWYTDLDHKMNLFRPLSSLFTTLNHQISRLDRRGYAFHSMLWYLASIVLIVLLVRVLFHDSGSISLLPVSFFTVLIFAAASRNMIFLIYGGARWMLITVTFGLAGLAAHLKWREQGWKPGRWLSVVAFLLCLLSGEAALAVLAYLAAYELFGSPDPLKKRIKSLLPLGILVFIYLVFYRLMDFGSANLELYTHPLNDPLGFISALPLKVAAMVGELFMGFISVLGIIPNGFTVPSIWPYLWTAAVALVTVGLLFYPVWSGSSPGQRRTFTWLLAGTAAAMFPLATPQPNSRVVFVLSIGGSILLAIIIHHWWKKIRSSPKSLLAWIGGLACLALLGIHLPYSAYHLFVRPQGLKFEMDEWIKYQNESVLNQIKPHQIAIFLNGTGGDDFVSGYRHRLVNHLPVPTQWWPLSYVEKKNRYLRAADNKLQLEIIEGCLYDSPNIGIGRYHKTPLKKGDVIKLSGFQVKILEVNQKGPTRMEFTFDRSLDDEVYVFYKLHEGKLQTIFPPATGQSVTL